MRYRAMGRSIAGKPSIAQTRRTKRLRKARRLRTERDKQNSLKTTTVGASKFGAFEDEDAYYFEYYRRLEEEEAATAENNDDHATPLEPEPEPDSDESDGIGDQFDLALDIAHQFLMGPEWQHTILSFVETHCNHKVFAPTDVCEGKFDHDNHSVWRKFCQTAETKVTGVLETLGLQADMLVRRCRRVLRTEGSRQKRHASEVVRALLVIDDFAAFCRLVLDCQGVSDCDYDYTRAQERDATTVMMGATPSAPPLDFLEPQAENRAHPNSAVVSRATSSSSSSSSSVTNTSTAPTVAPAPSACTDTERLQLLDLPVDWSQQIQVARAIASKKDFNTTEQNVLVPWATAALQLDTHTDASTLLPEELLALRSHVFLTRISVDVFVAQQLWQNVQQTKDRKETKQEDVLMTYLQRQTKVDH